MYEYFGFCYLPRQLCTQGHFSINLYYNPSQFFLNHILATQKDRAVGSRYHYFEVIGFIPTWDTFFTEIHQKPVR